MLRIGFFKDLIRVELLKDIVEIVFFDMVVYLSLKILELKFLELVFGEIVIEGFFLV